jgi:hypothetical protein
VDVGGLANETLPSTVAAVRLMLLLSVAPVPARSAPHKVTLVYLADVPAPNALFDDDPVLLQPSGTTLTENIDDVPD